MPDARAACAELDASRKARCDGADSPRPLVGGTPRAASDPSPGPSRAPRAPRPPPRRRRPPRRPRRARCDQLSAPPHGGRRVIRRESHRAHTARVREVRFDAAPGALAGHRHSETPRPSAAASASPSCDRSHERAAGPTPPAPPGATVRSGSPKRPHHVAHRRRAARSARAPLTLDGGGAPPRGGGADAGDASRRLLPLCDELPVRNSDATPAVRNNQHSASAASAAAASPPRTPRRVGAGHSYSDSPAEAAGARRRRHAVPARRPAARRVRIHVARSAAARGRRAVGRELCIAHRAARLLRRRGVGGGGGSGRSDAVSSSSHSPVSSPTTRPPSGESDGGGGGGSRIVTISWRSRDHSRRAVGAGRGGERLRWVRRQAAAGRRRRRPAVDSGACGCMTLQQQPQRPGPPRGTGARRPRCSCRAARAVDRRRTAGRRQ